MKYLGVILKKQVKNLYDRNVKSLRKEIEEDLKDRKPSHAHGLAALPWGKMAVLQKTICRFNAIPIKIIMQFFPEIERETLKFFWSYKKPNI